MADERGGAGGPRRAGRRRGTPGRAQGRAGAEAPREAQAGRWCGQRSRRGHAAAVAAALAAARGAPDADKVGNVCIDRYEASVWQIPPANTALVTKVQAGQATLADLAAGGATQLGPPPSCLPGYPVTFPADGNWTPVPGSDPPSPGVYAVSVPGTPPSACISWFQANQACQLAGKRLLTNREWQGAAAGTPDPGSADDGTTTCVTNSAGPAATGARASCQSNWGAFDMVGNVSEWVAEWSDLANNCTDWTTQTGIGGSDQSCFGGAGMPSGGGNNIPGALLRGGSWSDGTDAGVFAVRADVRPSSSGFIGFRCAR